MDVTVADKLARRQCAPGTAVQVPVKKDVVNQ